MKTSSRLGGASLWTVPGVPPLFALVALLGLWQTAAWVAGRESFPSAYAALRTIPAALAEPEAMQNIGASVTRMLLGFALGLAFAVPTGLVMGRSRRVHDFLDPLLTTTYPIPKAALMPIIMLWFGIGDLSKILVIFLGVSLPLVYHSYHGARRVDEKLIWSAGAMGTGAVGRVFRVILPAALPEVMLGCRVAISMALIVMVSSEMVARQSGMGNLLFNSMDMALYEKVYAMIVLISALGFVADVAFEGIRKRLTAWAITSDKPVLGPL